MPTRLTNEIIAAAIDGYEGQRKRIDQQIAELRAMLSGKTAEAAAGPETPKRKRRKMNAAGRKAVAATQRKRWARIRAESRLSAPATTEAPKAKRKLSRAGKAAIVAAAKKRWALKRAEAEKTAPKKSSTAPRRGGGGAGGDMVAYGPGPGH